MNRKWIGVLSRAMAVSLFLVLPGCGHDQKLVSIAVQPATVFFLTPDTTLTFQLTALGTYIHPPETKNITNSVIWSSDSSGLVIVNKAGVVTPSGNGSCGVANVTASFFTNSSNPAGNVVIGSATITVHNPAIAICP
jgi:hypothetical protein